MKTIVIATLMAGVLVTTAGCVSASRASTEASRGAQPVRRVVRDAGPAAFALPTPQHLAGTQQDAVYFSREPWQSFHAPGFALNDGTTAASATRTPRATTPDDARYSLARLNEMQRAGAVPPVEYQRTQSMLRAFIDPMQEARETLQWRDGR